MSSLRGVGPPIQAMVIIWIACTNIIRPPRPQIETLSETSDVLSHRAQFCIPLRKATLEFSYSYYVHLSFIIRTTDLRNFFEFHCCIWFPRVHSTDEKYQSLHTNEIRRTSNGITESPRVRSLVHSTFATHRLKICKNQIDHNSRFQRRKNDHHSSSQSSLLWQSTCIGYRFRYTLNALCPFLHP